jgi:hypothetical protein
MTPMPVLKIWAVRSVPADFMYLELTKAYRQASVRSCLDRNGQESGDILVDNAA